MNLILLSNLVCQIVAWSAGDSRTGTKLTYYGQGSNQDAPPYAPYPLGACGLSVPNHQYFVAMGEYANGGACGLCVVIRYYDKCSAGPIVDECPGCGNALDLSLHMFEQLAPQDQGVISNAKFELVSCPGDNNYDSLCA